MTDIDALLPAQMARRAEDIGVTKASLPLDRLFILAVLGGVFISLGAAFSTVVTAGGGLAPGVSRLLGGLTFALGLILVVVGGAELFTGNMLVVMAAASGRIRLGALARNWAVVYVGNLIGAVATAVLVFLSQQYRQGSGSVGERVLTIARTKSSLDVLPAVTLGVLANLLVCLAVWLSLSARSTVDRVVAVTVPIAAFVACGFEHSIANMYFLPIGMLVKDHAPDAFWSETASTTSQFTELTWTRAITHNLLPVTAGNIIGGGLLVAATYWFVYLRQPTVAAPSAPDGQT